MLDRSATEPKRKELGERNDPVLDPYQFPEPDPQHLRVFQLHGVLKRADA
jgi:hypothetical protein